MWLLEHYPLATVAVVAFLFAFVAQNVAARHREERRIQALGGHAPMARSWLPFGLALTYDAIKSKLNHRDEEFWASGFRDYGHPSRPYTIEKYIMGRRIIVTADEDNIKATLATQFHDFGKGRMFNEDWHDFLGDSKACLEAG